MRSSLPACALALVSIGCYDSFSLPDDTGDGSVERIDGATPVPEPAVTFSDGYELVYETIPSAPWLDAPPSGAECWPVRYSPRFSAEAVANLERALASWEAPCTRLCFTSPMPGPELDSSEGVDEGLWAVYVADGGPPHPLSAAMCAHGLFGDLRTVTVRIHVGAGRTPSVRQWARAIGLATGLKVTAEGLRSGVRSVLRGDLALDEGATASDRGALCRFYPR